MHLGGSLVFQTLMYPLLVVEFEIVLQAGLQFGHGAVLIQVDVLVFHGSPQTFDENVVQSAATAIHADADVSVQQHLRERMAGELHALVGVENHRRAGFQRLLQRIAAEGCVHGVGQPPRQHIAAVPVDYRGQIHEALRHRNIGDVSAPDLIDPVDLHVAQQVRIDLVLGRGLAGGRPRRDALYSHDPHQPLDALAVPLLAMLAVQLSGHAARTIERAAGVDLVNHAHDLHILVGNRHRLVIQRRAVKAQKLALATYADLFIVWLH